MHGIGDKWRTCPLWQQTARTLEQLLHSQSPPATPQAAVFAAREQPLTRYGIYKIVRRHAASLDDPRTGRRTGPHTFRHTAAVHLLGAGVEVNVIADGSATPTSPPPTATPRSTPKPNRKRCREPSRRVSRRDPAPTQSGGPTRRC